MATKHELELERARQLVADLEQKIAQEQTLLEGATRNMKELAISVHNAFCVAESHPGPNCQWRPGSEDDDADLADMIAELKALTPKPGLSYGRDSAAAIEPDVFVREKSGGEQ